MISLRPSSAVSESCSASEARRSPRSLVWLLAASSLCLLSACGGPREPAWPESAKKWFDRANASYRQGDLEDARAASDQALKIMPKEPAVRLAAADIALAELDFERALSLSVGLSGSRARGIRGRAYWYQGELEKAADELEALKDDPDVKDTWASDVAQLARKGIGRRPFEMSGGLVAAVEMPRSGSTAMIVPVEVNGEPGLALIATDSSETVVDAPSKEGSWISLRFGGSIEVSDVPALGRDLSGLKREIGAPIKLLIGVNLLRHLRPTIDFAGRQFVVRSFEPPAPPEATTVHPIYYRGGALVLPVAYGGESDSFGGILLMHTSTNYPVALDAPAWQKNGQDPASFPPIPGRAGLREGRLPYLRLGTFEMQGVPGVLGVPIAEAEKATSANLDGFAGSGLFATFRLTLVDGGKTLWLEDLPAEVIEEQKAQVARLRAGQEAAAAQRSAPAQSAPTSIDSPIPAPPATLKK